jgi:hypothetical protein
MTRWSMGSLPSLRLHWGTVGCLMQPGGEDPRHTSLVFLLCAVCPIRILDLLLGNRL